MTVSFRRCGPNSVVRCGARTRAGQLYSRIYHADVGRLAL